TERKCSPLLFGHAVEVLPSRLRARFVLTLHPWVSGAAASRKDAFSICDLLLHPRVGEDLRTWEEGPLVRVACPLAPFKRRGSVVEPEQAAELTARLELCPRQYKSVVASGFESDRGELYYREAMAAAEAQDRRPILADCHLGLGRLYSHTGKRQEAQEHLIVARTMYREMDMTFWLMQV